MAAMIKKLIFLVLVLPLLSASAVSAPATATTATAHASPNATVQATSQETPQASAQTMQLSSWQSEILDGDIVGGTQSVTIVNPTTSSINGVTFRLGTPPCECTLTGASAVGGTLEDNVWTIDQLAPGATVTLDLVYEGDR